MGNSRRRLFLSLLTATTLAAGGACGGWPSSSGGAPASTARLASAPGTAELPRSVQTPGGPPSWPVFTSVGYGYSLHYPPQWFDLGDGVSFEHSFSNSKQGTSPISLGPNDIFVGVTADCQYGIGPSVEISHSSYFVDSWPTVRYEFRSLGYEGPWFGAIATVEPVGYCYNVSMWAATYPVLESNLADFDRMIGSMRFFRRTAATCGDSETHSTAGTPAQSSGSSTAHDHWMSRPSACR